MVLTDENREKLRQIQSDQQQLVQISRQSERKPFRIDGYMNLLNKYGTAQDNSEHYFYALENQTPDTVLTTHYETNGLFAKIIDIPAQEAVKKGFKLNIADEKVEEYIQKKVRKLKFFGVSEDSLKWSRLYGGALAVMLIDDGSDDLARPVNWKKATKIEEIITYERALVTPDYSSLYSGYGVYGEKRTSKFRMPEYYNVFSIYGSFRVHESRCLIFRNGKMPEQASTSDYRFWGIPEYNRIKRALRETITAHGDAVRLLERSVQAIYKMKNLSQILSTDEGEDQALRRLEVIDMARGILNSIAIDSEGEDYDFKSITLTGVREVIDSACNMLSALTEIPQTKLFGRSPAGMNATGESDLENYYSFVDKIRETQLKDNLCTLVDAIVRVGINSGELTEAPEYELEFEPLWNEKESDRATIDQTNAQTDFVKAQTAQLYIDMGVLDPAEERRRLKNEGKFGIEDEELPQQESEPLAGLLSQLGHSDAADVPDSVGVLVIKDGMVLCGDREDNHQVCGPGGHIESWEDAEQAARRETEEEFGITVENLVPIGMIGGMRQEYGKPFLFLATDFKGSPLINTQEMRNNRFLPLSALKNEVLFEPFSRSIAKLLSELTEGSESDIISMDAEWNENDHPRDENGRFTSGGGSSGAAKAESKKEEESSKTKSQPQQKSLAVPEGADLRSRIMADTEGKMTIEEIVNDPVVQSAVKKYTVASTDETYHINTPERERKRQEAADDILNRGSITGYDEQGKAIYDGPVKKGYRAEIVIGPPAAGKSSVIVDRVSKNTGSRVLDSDEIKALLPEFDEGRGAGKVHKESSDVLNDLVIPQFGKGGSRQGDNIVIPIVGATSEKPERYLSMLKEAGYEVHLSFNDVTTQNSLKRAMMRYVSTGRFINPDYIVKKVGKGPAETYEKLKAKGGFDSYSKFGNNVPHGQPATKVERVNSKGQNINWEDWQ